MAESPLLTGLVVASTDEAWRAAGFDVERTWCRIGGVVIHLDPDAGSKGIRSWSFDRSMGSGAIDGIVTSLVAPTDVASVGHPNGVVSIDHVVVMTPDLPRTIAVLETAGFDLRKTRDSDTYGAPMRQAFFRSGDVILEVVSGVEPDPNGGPARLWGLAFNVDDLDASVAWFGPERCGRIKDAVQPGRRIATVKPEADLRAAVALMSAEPQS